MLQEMKPNYNLIWKVALTLEHHQGQIHDFQQALKITHHHKLFHARSLSETIVNNKTITISQQLT